jgi:hypothetical protein
MVFKFLSKPEAEIHIQSQNKGLPGTLLPVELRLIAQEAINARELRVELVGDETYYVKETHRDSKGRVETHVVKRTETIAKIAQTAAVQPVFTRGDEQKWNISLQLPSDAPPTCAGKLVNIQWKLGAVLDVPNRPDQSKEMPFFILCPAPRVNDRSLLPLEPDFNDFTLKLELPPAASPGETLVGRLTLQMKNKLNVQGIRVELIQVEDAGARKADDVILKSEISGSVAFSPSESPTFEFSLNIPPEAPPTALARHSSLRWKVKTVIARRMQTDFNVERELLLFNASAPSAK